MGTESCLTAVLSALQYKYRKPCITIEHPMRGLDEPCCSFHLEPGFLFKGGKPCSRNCSMHLFLS